MPKIGFIDTTELNTQPEEHELATAQFFANLGKDIRFIRPMNIKGVHTPDFYMDGLAWEVKSPTGRNVRSIEDNFRNASKQSKNIIFDLRRSKMWEPKCIAKIQKEAIDKTDVRKVVIITKDKKLLTVKNK